MEWTPRTRLIALGLAGLVVVMLAVFIAAAARDETVQPEPTVPVETTGPDGSPGASSTTRGVVAKRWPVDKAEARTVATRFAVPFSNHMPGGPNATQEWLDSIEPYADPEFVELVSRRFKDYWWYLLGGGLGAERARVVSLTPVWEKPDAAMYRVVVDREIRSFLGESRPRYTERVSWDVKVTSPTQDQPKVSGCLKTDPRPNSELSDPYSPGEQEGE
jgi:hypothetical protein